MENKLISSSSDVTTYSADEEEIYPEKFHKRSTILNSFKNHWLLNQNNHDSSSNISITDHSDIEFSGNGSDDDDLFSTTTKSSKKPEAQSKKSGGLFDDDSDSDLDDLFSGKK